jgi:serine/threonine protein kinase
VETPIGPGSRIDVYEVVDRLGAGGMGEVYRARDTRLGRTVALKVLRAGAEPELLHRLDREARAASALNHPNIVHIYDVGEAAAADGAHYVVMELVEGETLRRHLAQGPLPLGELLALGAQVAEGLALAHRAGIVHRDLKPENVMVTPAGTAKILDFGLAKVQAPLAALEARETLSRHGTQLGTLLGTLEYMSPEQASARPVDHRTDQFALGLILHEMATGRPVFRRDTPAQVLAAVIERDPEPLSRLRPDVPAALESLVTRCLQKDPDGRYPRTDDLAGELATLSSRARQATTAAVPISVEVLPPRPRAAGARYHVSVDDGVKIHDEDELIQLIRDKELTGLELVRRDDEERWQPLFETRVYRLEVPNAGDPRNAARMRALSALGGHWGGFFITMVVLYNVNALDWWIWIWVSVLGMQTLGNLPSIWALLRRRGSEPLSIQPPAPVQAIGSAAPVPSALNPAASVVEQEAARVRVLIQRRGGSDAARLVAEVDGIQTMTAVLAEREADLEEQTSEGERSALAAAIASARERLERADLPEDRRLFERQLEVLLGREEAIGKAVRVLERLRVRRDLAEHQLKQLRLDLSRGAASGLDVPELSSRLQFIRYEVDAREEVEQIAADRS